MSPSRQGELYRQRRPDLNLTGAIREKRRTGIEPASSPWKGEALPLSYHRASEAAPTSGAAPVTVCTNDLALCNLVEDALPVPISNSLGDVEFLVPEMVELEHDRIGLPAVCARMLAQEGDQIGDALGGNSFLPDLGLIDVSLTVGSVVLLLIGSPARPAVVIPLPACLSPPSKVLERLLLVTSPASPHPSETRHSNRCSY
jgi:hypothetical protein